MLATEGISTHLSCTSMTAGIITTRQPLYAASVGQLAAIF